LPAILNAHWQNSARTSLFISRNTLPIIFRRTAELEGVVWIAEAFRASNREPQTGPPPTTFGKSYQSQNRTIRKKIEKLKSFGI
jgi:hypothetical protein